MPVMWSIIGMPLELLRVVNAPLSSLLLQRYRLSDPYL
jgi:hypothetical protein